MRVYKHSDYDYVDIVEIPKSEVKKIDLCMCAQPKETLGSFYSRQNDKPDVLMNAGFFATSTGNTVFNVMDDGVVYSENEKYKWGIGIQEAHKDLLYGSLASNSYYKFVDFVSGYPNLVDSGKSCAPWTWATDINYNALRSMIGYNDNYIYFVTISKPGMTFTKMANLMIDIGCKYAVNLDGGGSSRLMVGGEVINVPTENRAVDSVFALWLTDEARDAYYGVEEDKDYYEYVVQKGDSWWKIAANECGSGYLYDELMEYNNWDEDISLQPGDIIKIPNNKFKEEENSADDSTDDSGTDVPSSDVDTPSDTDDSTSDSNDSTTGTDSPNTPTDPDDTETSETPSEDDTQVDGEVDVFKVVYNKNDNKIIFRTTDGKDIISISLNQ